jgi:hypothetical protein
LKQIPYLNNHEFPNDFFRTIPSAQDFAPKKQQGVKGCILQKRLGLGSQSSHTTANVPVFEYEMYFSVFSLLNLTTELMHVFHSFVDRQGAIISQGTSILSSLLSHMFFQEKLQQKK